MSHGSPAARGLSTSSTTRNSSRDATLRSWLEWACGAAGIELIARGIGEELRRRLPGQRRTQRENLALLVATMLDARSANLMELAAAPRAAERIDMRYRWLARVLAHPRIDCDAVMGPFAREVLARAHEAERVEPILDQSKLSDCHQVLMRALRFGERALPMGWRVEETAGAMGWSRQKPLLDLVAPWLPEEAAVVVLADRSHGTVKLIAACVRRQWDYRPLLKGNLRVPVQREAPAPLTRVARTRPYLAGVEPTTARVATNIGVIHDHRLRRSVFKSRGFGLDDTQIRYPDRLARLVLVMALAIHCAVSTGLRDQSRHPLPAQARPTSKQPRTAARSRTSWFTRGPSGQR